MTVGDVVETTGTEEVQEPTLAARLRAHREERGISQSQAARELDVARTAYRLWEMEAARPAPDRWRLLARWLGVSMTTLRDNIQRLVDRRLVRRTRNPDDGRSYRLVLTARGETMIRAADPALAEAYSALRRLLPRPLAEYEQMLDELNAALEGVVTPATAETPRAPR